MSDTPREVPLIELLRSIPSNARLWIDDKDGMGSTHHSVGNLMHRAADELAAATARAAAHAAAPAAPQSVEPGDPMGNWLMKPCLEWLEQAEHGENKQRCQMIADILRDLWRRQKPLEGIDGSAAPGREG